MEYETHCGTSELGDRCRVSELGDGDIKGPLMGLGLRNSSAKHHLWRLPHEQSTCMSTHTTHRHHIVGYDV